MKYVLILLFHINGQPQFVDGFLPLFFETEDQCQLRLVEAQKNLEQAQGLPPFTLNCYEQLPSGLQF